MTTTTTATTIAGDPLAGIGDGGELVFAGPLRVRQLAVLALDLSGSMGGRNPVTGTVKADDVADHVTDPVTGIVARLAQSRQRDGFDFCLATHDTATAVRAIRPVTAVTPADLALSLADHGGATNTAGCLRDLKGPIAAWLAAPDPDGLPRRGIVVYASDGEANTGGDPVTAAAELRAMGVEIACAAYGEIGGAGEATLQAMASTGPSGRVMFKRVGTGAELREFFIASTLRKG
jgi:hypothetical protein